MARADQFKEVRVEGDLLGAKTVDKVYTDAEGARHHEDFIELRLLLRWDADVLAKLLAIYRRHELCVLDLSLSQGELGILDTLADNRADAKAAQRVKAEA